MGTTWETDRGTAIGDRPPLHFWVNFNHRAECCRLRDCFDLQAQTAIRLKATMTHTLHCKPLGIKKIDRQHNEFLRIIDEFRKHIAEDMGVETMEEVFDRLLDYARLHFRDEEVLMSRSGYSGLARHQAEHRKLLVELRERMDECLGIDHPHPERVLQILLDWVQNHVDEEDVPMGIYLVEKGVS